MFSEREQELLNTLTECCNVNRIDVRINELPENIEGPIALDVEHDESGNFVGCGILVAGSNTVYYYSDLHSLSCLPFDTLAIIAHNGISDFECLRQWDCDVKNEQLVHDTQLIGHILDSSQGSYGLKDMAKRELNIDYPDYDSIVGKHKNKTKKSPKCPRILSDCCGRRTLDKWPVEIVSLYNGMDCVVTYKLYQRQIRLIKP